ncbi:MAG: MoxR family ATPase [Candidatus Hydrothermae bacterium]|nr:MoxR family ATPase [Candidatus Hydrothermae bacterium]
MNKRPLSKVIENVSTVVKGEEKVLKLAMTALLARGHLLLEGVPGVGKTTLALALARSLGLSFQRTQFTSDLLPADILGFSVYDPKTGEFTFKPGPVFNNIVLADEINRATPRTQSALLEAMGEGQVTIEGRTFRLPQPFLVIATQNPLDLYGTFPLPDSQLDRFLLKIVISYPPREAEAQVLKDGSLREKAHRLQPVSSPDEIEKMQLEVEKVWAEEVIVQYILDIAEATRRDPRFSLGLSTRGALHLLKAAKAWAYIEGRDYVVPDDIKEVAPYVVTHRIRLSGEGLDPVRAVLDILERTEIPL